MVVAIIWFAKIKIARQTFVGFAWGPGSLMEVPGIIATGNFYYLRGRSLLSLKLLQFHNFVKSSE